MRRIVTLATIIFVIVVSTNLSMFAGSSQPVATGITNENAPNMMKGQGLAALIALRPVPSYSTPQSSKPIPIACVEGGNPCSNNAQCCSRVCKSPADGWAGRGKYCASAD
jgi:hypothetical protein